jgi:DNA-binding Lrp family transcriptional regulator
LGVDDIRFLEALSNNLTPTYENLAALLDMQRCIVSRRIDKLRKRGKVEREGAKKNDR